MPSFPLAPMASSIRLLTGMMLAIPALFAGAALTGRANEVLLWAALILVGVYASVWIWLRPARFEVGTDGLRLRFPGRTRLVSGPSIARVRVLDPGQFRSEFGWAIRVGVGGLWGAFGWLWTRGGWVELYISRLDRYLLIERRGAIPLLLTPADPDSMRAALRALTPGGDS